MIRTAPHILRAGVTGWFLAAVFASTTALVTVVTFTAGTPPLESLPTPAQAAKLFGNLEAQDLSQDVVIFEDGSSLSFENLYIQGYQYGMDGPAMSKAGKKAGFKYRHIECQQYGSEAGTSLTYCSASSSTFEQAERRLLKQVEEQLQAAAKA